jgi:hypothetical protein
MTNVTQSNNNPTNSNQNQPKLTYWHVWTDDRGSLGKGETPS